MKKSCYAASLRCTTSWIAIHALSAGVANAQEVAQAVPAVEELVVTGTRIVRDNYSSPTPLAILSAEEAELTAPRNLADALNNLPQFRGSSKSDNPGNSANAAGAGGNYLDLRNLGFNRNLILLDGRRLGPTNLQGGVDINLLPQGLVKRVEVVTGGASAAYGSDAVTGVVNFVLDKSFSGVKGQVQSGISDVGDSRSWKATVSGGSSFAGGRGHIVGNVEFYDVEAIPPYSTGRDWQDRRPGLIPNIPAGQLPLRLTVAENVNVSAGNFAGLITTGPLRGTTFGPSVNGGSGQPMPFEFGEEAGSTFMIGGDGIYGVSNLTAAVKRKTAFLHMDYEPSDDIEVFVEASYANVNTPFEQYPSFIQTQGAYEIFADNAFLPDSTRAQMQQLGIASFRLGRIHTEGRRFITADNTNEVWRAATGMNGDFDAAERTWRYGLYYTHSESQLDIKNLNDPVLRNVYAAADAVVDPDTGSIVCRSTLVEGLDSGCVPSNLFGVGALSQESLDYILGTSEREQRFKFDFFSASIQGDLFSLPAGAVALAVGFEYRKESTTQTVDPISESQIDFSGIRGAPAALDGRLGGFLVGNPQALEGSYSVSEGFTEVLVPLARNQAFADLLEVNAAARLADYSTSGRATTWKLGVNYAPVEDVRLRVTRSRDIRGPNIAELFTASTQSLGSVRDPVTGALIEYTGSNQGNPDLDPEKADTLTFGAVYQPSWLQGLSVSADWFDIEINGAIASTGAQVIMDECAKGNQIFCSQVQQVAGGALRITVQQLNLAAIETSGLDLSAAYTTPVGPGALTLHGAATYTDKLVIQNPGAEPKEHVGTLGNGTDPAWTALCSANYAQGPFALTLQGRYIGDGYYDRTWVEGIEIDDNSVPSVWYADAIGQWNSESWGRPYTVYVTVNNLFDKDPPLVPGFAAHLQRGTNQGLYDTIGRYFTVGVKLEF